MHRSRPRAVSPRVSSFVSPVVDVRCGLRGAHASSRVRGRAEAVDEWAASARAGSPWRLEDAELGTWIARLLPLAADVVVVSPETLRDAMLTRLHAAATWGDDDA